MTATKRILDMLPALVMFALVAALGTYIAVAYVVHDPFWLNTVAELREQQAAGDRAPVENSAA